MERRTLRRQLKTACNLFDQFANPVTWNESREILEIDNLCGNDGATAKRRLRSQRLEVGEARYRVFALR